MLITTHRPLPTAARPSASSPQAPSAVPAAEQPNESVALSAGEDPSGQGSVKWGAVAALVATIGASTGLAASGLGAISAVPAFLVGGVAGLALAHEGVDALISNGRDSSGTGPIAAFAGLLGGVGGAIGGAAWALNHGGPMLGLGAGAAAMALSLGYGLYLRNH